MTSTTVFHDMTSARAEHVQVDPADDENSWVIYRVKDDDGSYLTIIVKTAAQADELIKAGVAALNMLTQDGAPPPAECGPGVCTCGRTVDHNGGVHEAGETP